MMFARAHLVSKFKAHSHKETGIATTISHVHVCSSSPKHMQCFIWTFKANLLVGLEHQSYSLNQQTYSVLQLSWYLSGLCMQIL